MCHTIQKRYRFDLTRAHWSLNGPRGDSSADSKLKSCEDLCCKLRIRKRCSWCLQRIWSQYNLIYCSYTMKAGPLTSRRTQAIDPFILMIISYWSTLAIVIIKQTYYAIKGRFNRNARFIRKAERLPAIWPCLHRTNFRKYKSYSR